MAYFDNNATTPLAGTVFEAFQTALEKGWANPSSPSAFSLTSEETRRILRVSSYVEQDQKDWQSLADAFQLAFDELSEEASASPVISV